MDMPISISKAWLLAREFAQLSVEDALRLRRVFLAYSRLGVDENSAWSFEKMDLLIPLIDHIPVEDLQVLGRYLPVSDLESFVNQSLREFHP
jgi:hypothetical protein